MTLIINLPCHLGSGAVYHIGFHTNACEAFHKLLDIHYEFYCNFIVYKNGRLEFEYSNGGEFDKSVSDWIGQHKKMCYSLKSQFNKTQ